MTEGAFFPVLIGALHAISIYVEGSTAVKRSVARVLVVAKIKKRKIDMGVDSSTAYGIALHRENTKFEGERITEYGIYQNFGNRLLCTAKTTYKF